MSEKLSWNAKGDWQAQGGWGTLDSAGRGFYLKHWQDRLDALRAAHHVPGATLAVLVGGEIHELASGVLHRGTGVEATTDSVFLSGSIAKVYTARHRDLLQQPRVRRAGPHRRGADRPDLGPGPQGPDPDPARPRPHHDAA
ncbi:serine hydrolase [Streptosporangium roseum]|uniref:serine hydrolase n=1 Tax=Streptosporangium roseum TaxID=2001 RepID=UPI00332CAC64